MRSVTVPFTLGGRKRFRAEPSTWLRLLRGGSVSSISLSKRIAPTRLPLRVSSRAKVVASSPKTTSLRPVDRAEPHRW